MSQSEQVNVLFIHSHSRKHVASQTPKRRMHYMKLTLFSGSVIILSTLLLASCSPAEGKTVTPGQIQEQPTVPEVDVVKLKAAPFSSVIEATGTALPIRESFLSSEVPGKIKKYSSSRDSG